MSMGGRVDLPQFGIDADPRGGKILRGVRRAHDGVTTPPQHDDVEQPATQCTSRGVAVCASRGHSSVVAERVRCGDPLAPAE